MILVYLTTVKLEYWLSTQKTYRLVMMTKIHYYSPFRYLVISALNLCITITREARTKVISTWCVWKLLYPPPELKSNIVTILILILRLVRRRTTFDMMTDWRMTDDWYLRCFCSDIYTRAEAVWNVALKDTVWRLFVSRRISQCFWHYHKNHIILLS